MAFFKPPSSRSTLYFQLITLAVFKVWVPHIWRALCARCGKPQISPAPEIYFKRACVSEAGSRCEESA